MAGIYRLISQEVWYVVNDLTNLSNKAQTKREKIVNLETFNLFL